jgi:peptidoglycan/LPS O-acetylase OafA/YrhL
VIKTTHFGRPLALVLQCVAIGLFLLGALRGEWLRAWLGHQALTTVGGMCYTLYLIHLPIIEFVTAVTVHRLPGLSYWLLLPLEAVLITPLVLVSGIIAYLLVEQPCMNKAWPTQLYDRLRSRFHCAPAGEELSLASEKPAGAVSP